MRVLFLLAGAIWARHAGFQYKIQSGNFPEVRVSNRVVAGNKFSVAFKNPKDNQQTVILYVPSDKVNKQTKKLKLDKADDKGHVNAELLYIVTNDTFTFAGYKKPPVPEDEAVLDREKEILTFSDTDGTSAAGYYWSIVTTTEGENKALNMDFATKVTIVEKCKIVAKWTNDIDEGYGWQNTANGIEFNTKGFNPGTTFATCQFRSQPEVELFWNVEGEEFGAGKSQIDAKVPSKGVRLPELITCAVKDDASLIFDNDQCEGDFRPSVQIASPPSQLQYATEISEAVSETVWTYISNEDSQFFDFTCPMIDQAEVVTAVSGDWQSPIKNQVASSLLPEDFEKDESSENDEEETKQFVWTLDSNGYKGTVNMKNFGFGVKQFRCKYETDGALMGYSRPHIVLKYDSSVRADITVVPKWGLDVDPQSPVLLESSKRINFASCAQKTNGPPAPMALKVSSKDQTIYIPNKFARQHYISLNSDVPAFYDLAEVSCSWKNENGTEIEEKLEKHLEVIFRPREITVEKSGELVTCSVVASRKDMNLVASLSIDKNYLMPVNFDNTDDSLKVPGKAIFNLTQAYTAEALKKVEFSGYTCLVTSGKFPDQTFESIPFGAPEPTEAPSTEIDVHLTGPILLCLIGAGAVLAICFKMPGNNPIEKGEYKLANNEENDKNDQEIDEDPLCSNKSISEA